MFELPSGYYPGFFAKLVTAKLNRDKLSELLQVNTTEQSNHGIISIVPSESNQLQKKIRRLALQMSTMALAPGDFNNDGFTDIAVAGWASSDHAAGGITILLGDGKGNLKRTRILDACDGRLSIAAGDIDRDGNLDLAVSGLLDSICLYYGDGKLGFKETRINMQPFTAPFTDVTITNVDGDQFPDLLVAAQSGNVIYIIGTKEGGNSLVPVVGHRSTPPFSIVAGDLDRNGISDIPTTVGFGSVINLSCCGRNGFYNHQRIHVSADYLHLTDLNKMGMWILLQPAVLQIYSQSRQAKLAPNSMIQSNSKLVKYRSQFHQAIGTTMGKWILLFPKVTTGNFDSWSQIESIPPNHF